MEETVQGCTRYRVHLAYDGAPFSGWAVQPGLSTVQGSLEAALERVVRRPVRTVVAGRTDAGVHARGQVVHLDLRPGEAADREGMRDPEALCRRLNGALGTVLGKDRVDQGLDAVPGALRLLSVASAAPGFDARFSAVGRRYSYRIRDAVAGFDPLDRQRSWWVERELDVAAMNRAGQALLGLHDFLSFCRPREGATTIRTLTGLSFDRGEDGALTARVSADAFCHHMVRSLVGASVAVGAGTVDPLFLERRLDERSRATGPAMAPPQGLVLEEVLYPPEEDLAEQAERTRARRAL